MRTADYRRIEHRKLLRESPTVLDAAYEAGLSGPGRLHDLIVNVYAVTPGDLKGEGAARKKAILAWEAAKFRARETDAGA